MKKWNVYAFYTASRYVGVIEAETKEEAKEKAWGADEDSMVTLCHQCAGEVEMNGDPHEYDVEEADDSDEVTL